MGPNKIECVDKFCYVVDMIGAGGGMEEAARNRVRCAWGKFNELAPILISRCEAERKDLQNMCAERFSVR